MIHLEDLSKRPAPDDLDDRTREIERRRRAVADCVKTLTGVDRTVLARADR